MTNRSEHNLTEIVEGVAHKWYLHNYKDRVEGGLMPSWADLGMVEKQEFKQNILPVVMRVLDTVDEVEEAEAQMRAKVGPAIPDPDQPGEFVILTAVTVEGPNRVTAEEFLHRVLPDAGTNDRGNPDHLEVTSWWIAEDERRDRSDNDSAVFVIPGKQDEAIALLRKHGLGH